MEKEKIKHNIINFWNFNSLAENAKKLDEILGNKPISDFETSREAKKNEQY